MICFFKGNGYEVRFAVTENAVRILGGYFGQMALKEGPFWAVRVKDLATGENAAIESDGHWGAVKATELGNTIRFYFEAPAGICGAWVSGEDGTLHIEEYPQTTKNGKPCQLMTMCQSDHTWHKIIEKLTRDMERELPVDGIYFDEIANEPCGACYSHEHDHLPGGGSFWTEGSNRLARQLKEGQPRGSFYFTECNGEVYMKHFDGLLTWMWVEGNEVPAFPAVYAGYIQMIGRNTSGVKKEDFAFFKYCTTRSLLNGQVLGWCKADIVYSPRHMEFLKILTDVRYRFANLFSCSDMLRPPKTNDSLEEYTTAAGMGFAEDIHSRYVLAGAWRYKNRQKIVIFAVNFAEEAAEYTLSFNAAEYGIKDRLSADFTLEGDTATVAGKIGRYEVKIWEM